MNIPFNISPSIPHIARFFYSSWWRNGLTNYSWPCLRQGIFCLLHLSFTFVGGGAGLRVFFIYFLTWSPVGLFIHHWLALGTIFKIYPELFLFHSVKLPLFWYSDLQILPTLVSLLLTFISSAQIVGFFLSFFILLRSMEISFMN